MSLLSKKAVVLLLAAVAGLGALNAQAAKPKEKASTNNVSMLDGKFTFVLPKGFTADPLPAGPTGAKGTMYTNQATKTVVIAAENQIAGGGRWDRGVERTPAAGVEGRTQGRAATVAAEDLHWPRYRR